MRLALTLAALWSLTAVAAETSRGLFEVTSRETSDGIADRILAAEFRNHRREFFWPYAAEEAEGWDWGARFERHLGFNTVAQYAGERALGLFGRKLSPSLRLDAAVGAHRLGGVGVLSSATTRAIGELEAFYAPLENLKLALKLSHDWLYADLIQPLAVTGQLFASSASFRAVYSPAERISLRGNGSVRAFSDGNPRRAADLSALYGISTGVPWVWVGLGGEVLSYGENRSGYWSPTRFWSFGARLEAAVPIVGELSASGGLNLNVIREESRDPAQGYYGSASLQYGNRERFHVTFAYNRVSSIQGSGTWAMDELMLSVATPL